VAFLEVGSQHCAKDFRREGEGLGRDEETILGWTNNEDEIAIGINSLGWLLSTFFAI
jgi:hypothetical protein